MCDTRLNTQTNKHKTQHMHTVLSNKERNILFWASFLALFVPGMGFGIRVINIGTWSSDYNISMEAAGGLFGASLWPIAVGMIVFSLIVDKIGYKTSMLLAFLFQAGAAVYSIFAPSLVHVTWSFIIAGFAHGIVEAVINPLCATMYKRNKSKMLNILHAAWPAGIVLGAAAALLLDMQWQALFWLSIPFLVVYGIMFFMVSTYPEDERVENNISYRQMFQEYGGLGVFLAVTILFFQLSTGAGWYGEGKLLGTANPLYLSLGLGGAAGLVGAVVFKSVGKILFFITCLIMIPLATAELATDSFIRSLMAPVLKADYKLDSGWAIVLSSFIMMVLRFFAGVPLKFMTPVMLLIVSAIFSAAGLYMLSFATGMVIFVAFVLYGVGQTFYWPTVLGFTSEQFPKGGAMTINTITAMGMLGVGVFGNPYLGSVADDYNTKTVVENRNDLLDDKALFYSAKDNKVEEKTAYLNKDKTFMWKKRDVVNKPALEFHPELLTEEGKKLASDIVKVQALSEEKKKELNVDTNALVISDAPLEGEKLKASRKAKQAFAEAGREKTYNEAGLKLFDQMGENGRNVLRVAAIFPIILMISFGLIWIYFKLKGGYKAVHLDEADYDGNPESGALNPEHAEEIKAEES